MGRLIRMISSDGTLTVMAADTTDIVNKAEKIHKTSAVVSAALGRLLTAASFMGAVIKQENGSVTLRINGGGPAGSVIAVADSSGNVRGYAANPVVEIPLNAKGKLDVSGAVGTNGTLTVMRDFGFGEPYVGQIPIATGEIAEDITSYYAVSEQVPTVCALGVLVNPDLTIKAAGGFIIQLLPSAAEDTITAVEKAIEGIEPVTTLLARGMAPADICRHVLNGFDLEELDGGEIEYKCHCSRERVSAALVSLGRTELEDMAKQPETEVSCQFCPEKYIFTSADIKQMIKESE